jgi:hypothetical protein
MRGCGNWTSNLTRITKSKTRFGAGTYIVRTDISPGTYRSRAGGACYWARLCSFTGSTSAIISNDNVVGSTIVTIRRTDRGFIPTVALPGRGSKWVSVSLRFCSNSCRQDPYRKRKT